MEDKEIDGGLEDEDPHRLPDFGPLYDCRTAHAMEVTYIFLCYCPWCKGKPTPHACPVVFRMVMN